MLSNIMPYVCGNVAEFGEERRLLRELTFPKVSEQLSKNGIYFNPVQIDWNETNDAYFKSGNLLRLLLMNISNCAPFFIGLVGFKYGRNVKTGDNHSTVSEGDGRESKSAARSALEKNILVCCKTGYHEFISSNDRETSLLEYQINFALRNEHNYPYYRFYFRQYEYLEEKFAHLSIADRKRAIRHYEAEDEHSEKRIKDLKMRIAKKGIVVRYYKSLDELNQFLIEDINELIKTYVRSYIVGQRPMHLHKIDTQVMTNLRTYLMTDSLRETLKNIDQFVKQRPVYSVHFKLESENSNYPKMDDIVEYLQIESVDGSINDDKDDYLEILKLRHLNLSNSMSTHSSQKSSAKQVFIVSGERGMGKTSFMYYLYKFYMLNANNMRHFSNISSSTMTTTTTPSNDLGSTSGTVRRKQPVEQFFLFYFLKPRDHLISVLFDITCKMRAKYLKKDSRSLLLQELHEKNSIIEQFQASLSLGAVCVFIDGLSELDASHSIKLNKWFPSKLEPECKFIFTLNKSSEYMADLAERKSSCINELKLFGNDKDYLSLYDLLYGVDNLNQPDFTNTDRAKSNFLFSRFSEQLKNLKRSLHKENPLYVKLIAHEIFSFDKEIYQTNAEYSEPNVNVNLEKSLYFDADEPAEYGAGSGDDVVTASSIKSSTIISNPITLLTSYIEEVSNIREIIQKIIKRYLKKNNWSTNTNVSLSTDNPGWVGDVLCLISVSTKGLNKNDIFRILEMRGYKDNLKITDLHWAIFRMKFSNFIVDGENGKLEFTHRFFKEAVQTILLDGFGVMSDYKTAPDMQSFKLNISQKQKVYHLIMILDILQNRLKKSDLDSCSQIEKKFELLKDTHLIEKCLNLIHELAHHFYMIYDLISLCKLITNFKVLQIFYSNRLEFMSEWHDLCEYFQLSGTSDIVRPILIGNFTLGMPNYQVELRDECLYVNRKSTRDEYEYYTSRLEYTELRNPSTASSLGNSKHQPAKLSEQQSVTNDSLVDAEQLQQRELQRKQQQQQQQQQQQVSVLNLDDNSTSQFYEPLIDALFDFSNDSLDLSKTKYGDTVNLTLINRTLILVDLVNYVDKYFAENYSLLFAIKIYEIINQNYPLNELEKFKFTELLQKIGRMFLQINNFEVALKYLLKCIELLEDFFESFSQTNIDRKLKNKSQLLKIGNRLSFLYSMTALIMIKLENLSAVEIFLTKASNFNSEKLSTKIKEFNNDLDLEKNLSKLEMEIKERTDNTKLVYRQSLRDLLQQVYSLSINQHSLMKNCDDGASYEANFYFNFISGLFEVQKLNFKIANKFFQFALNTSLKWYGQCHTNTSKIYHYYGCFFSLQDRTFYNPRRAELYLRKALFISEKQLESSSPSRKSKYNTTNEPAVNTNKINIEQRISKQEEDEEEEATSQQISLNKFNNNNNPTATKPQNNQFKLDSSELENTIAEILFDLGSLLSTYEAKISKNEAVDCLRRSLDIKILILGASHWECEIIKKKLNEVSVDTAQCAATNTNPMATPVSRLESLDDNLRALLSRSSSINNKASATPRVTSSCKLPSARKSLDKFVNKRKQESDMSKELDKWIANNSIIEVIPPMAHKMNLIRLEQRKYDIETEKSTTVSSKSNEYLQTSEYTDTDSNTLIRQAINKNSNLMPARTMDHETATVSSNTDRQSPTSNKSKLNTSPMSHASDRKLKLRTSLSLNIPNVSLNQEPKVHLKTCKCPTAISIDIHNVKSVHGPNSSIKKLLDVNQTPQDLRQKSDSKIVRKVYYRTAWYDMPPGSTKTRLKQFVKVAPNA